MTKIKTGVYCIRCIVNNKRYIGSSTRLSERVGYHKYQLCRNHHFNKYLQSDYNLYGENNFEFKILEECSKEELIVTEDKWIEYYNSLNTGCGYNQVRADKTDSKGMLGKHHSEETKKRLSEVQIGKKLSYETKLKIGKASKGRKLSESAKAKLSQSRLGMKFSEEHRANLSKSQRGTSKPLCDEAKKHVREIRQKPVIQYTLAGVRVGRWNSPIEVEEQLGYTRQCIAMCCRGKRKTHKGYIWKYEEDESK
jgi:group I intron endonuclease